MGDKLTEKQYKIYTIIKDFIENKGYSPTVREIGKLAGLSSPATAYHHIEILKDKGYITYISNMYRTIRIVKEIKK